MKKKIFYIGNFSFPYGNASGARVLGNGFLFKEIGYEVSYIGVDNNVNSYSSLEDTLKVYKDFNYYNLPYPLGMNGWLLYKKRFYEVRELLEKHSPDVVILYGSPALSIFGKLILNWSRKNKIICLTDCVDWLNSGTGSFLHRIVKFLDNSYQKQILNKQTDGVITISSYLSNYYKNKKQKTVIIPPLIDPGKYKDLDYQRDESRKIKLIYIGQPFATDGRKVQEKSFKDRLDKVINILFSLQDFDFVFHIYGITKNEYLRIISAQEEKIEKLGSRIFFHGKIKNENAIEKIAESHFTILFRDKNRMTSSGFPTKFVETLSCGTPIITTNTSDLEDYIKEGENGFFIDLVDEERALKKMKFIFSLDVDEIYKMKKTSKMSETFDYKNFIGRLKPFMESFKI